jgi:hypothetical protein
VADFNVMMPRDLTQQEWSMVQAAPDMRCEDFVRTEADRRTDSDDAPTPGRRILVLHAIDEDDAKARVVAVLGLDAQEAAALTVRPVAGDPA